MLSIFDEFCREANTYSECASSLNNGKCRERVTSCEDCNKVVSNSTLLFNFTTIVVSFYEQVIDCEIEQAAENGVEKLVASKCSIGSDQEARVFCFDVCSENTEDQDNCKCGTMVYKHGREIHEEELNEYGVSCGGAVGVPLTELTALVHTFVYISTNFFGTTGFLGWNSKLSFTLWTHD